jgi:hypothetical protein
VASQPRVSPLVTLTGSSLRITLVVVGVRCLQISPEQRAEVLSRVYRSGGVCYFYLLMLSEAVTSGDCSRRCAFSMPGTLRTREMFACLPSSSSHHLLTAQWSAPLHLACEEGRMAVSPSSWIGGLLLMLETRSPPSFEKR